MAIQDAFIVAALLCGIGIVTSAMRGAAAGGERTGGEPTGGEPAHP